MLGHIHLSLIAIAQVLTGSVVFTDGCDDLEEALRSSGSLRLLARSELEIPIRLIDTSDLDRAERREITFWKPKTLGELLFNYWD